MGNFATWKLNGFLHNFPLSILLTEIVALLQSLHYATSPLRMCDEGVTGRDQGFPGMKRRKYMGPIYGKMVMK